VPDGGLIGQHAADFELDHVTFSTTVPSGGVGIVAGNIQSVDGCSLIGERAPLGEDLAFDQAPD
jgi:hypothetical protein